MIDFRVGLIPAAGKGNRIDELPLTRVLPKPMLPILNKPILEYAIGNMKLLGVRTVYIIVGHKKEAIKQYFGTGQDWNLEIEYVEQTDPKGIAHAISLVENYVSEPFLVILGDDLTITNSLSNLAETFWKNQAWVVEGTVEEKDVEALKRTCCLMVNENGKVTNIEEKPSRPMSYLRGCGVYIFDPIVFDFIKKTPITPARNEKEITNTLKIMAEHGKVYGHLLNGVNINVNTFGDLLKATKLLLSANGKTP